MLLTRGLGALLLGTTATASVLNRIPSNTDTQIQLSRGNELEALRDGSDQSATESSIGRFPPTTTAKGTRWSPRGPRRSRLRSRQDDSSNSSTACPANTTTCQSEGDQVECCAQGTTCCLLDDGRFGCCPITCDVPGGPDCQGSSSALSPDNVPLSTPAGADNVPFATRSRPGSNTLSTFAGIAGPTVFVTQTITSTVTAFTGVPTTGLVTVTNTIPITVINPIERTSTVTVTATSFFRRGPAAQGIPEVTAVPESVEEAQEIPEATTLPASFEVGKRQEPAITSTTTVEVFTTVFQQSVVLGTLTNTVFTTTFLAPNAVTTVFVTTTVFLPSGAIPSTVAPTAPGSTFVPVPSSTTSTTSNLPSSAPTSSIPPSSSSSETSTSLTTMNMETMSTRPPTTTAAAPSPTMMPMSAPATGLTTTQIIGIAVGALVGIILIVALAFCLRRMVQRRRAAQAQMRQQLTPPSVDPLPTAALPRRGPRGGGGALAPPILPLPKTSSGNSGANSSASDPNNSSFLSGEGEVRIVIRPTPKRRTQSSQLFPMPPNYRGQSFNLYVDETTTGETTPQDPGEWSIASEMGSIKDGKEGLNKTVVYSTNDPGSGSGSEERASGSGGRPTTSLFSSAWDRETYGRRSDVSYPGLGTLLTPPPAWHGHATERGWPHDPPSIIEEASRRTSGIQTASAIQLTPIQPGQSTSQSAGPQQISFTRESTRESIPYSKLDKAELGYGRAF